MEPEITPEQKAQLTAWAGQRDMILSEISVLQTARETLEKSNKEKATSFADMESRMNQVFGRIEELKKKEDELPLLISRDIAQLQEQKTVLESEITNLSKFVEVLTVQKLSIEKDVTYALATFDILKEEATTLDKIIDHVTRVSENNATKINLLVKNLGESLEEIIAVNKKNVNETNTVIEKLPAMLVEAQKHGLIKNKV